MDADITHTGQLGVLSTLGLMAVIMGITMGAETHLQPMWFACLARVVRFGAPPRALQVGPWEIFRVVANNGPRRAWY